MYTLVASIFMTIAGAMNTVNLSRTICKSDDIEDIYNALADYKHILPTSKILCTGYGIAKPAQIARTMPKKKDILGAKSDVWSVARYDYMSAPSETFKEPIKIAELNLVLCKTE